MRKYEIKYLVTFLILLYPLNVFGNNDGEIDASYVEFAKIMGIYQMVDNSMKQTELSMRKQMKEITNRMYERLPKLTTDQKSDLDQIIIDYLTSITSSVDVDTAVNLYMGELAKSMSKEEVEYASNFYRSEKGIKVQKTLAEASQKFNTYFLTQIENANKKNHPIFMDELDRFIDEAYQKKN